MRIKQLSIFAITARDVARIVGRSRLFGGPGHSLEDRPCRTVIVFDH